MSRVLSRHPSSSPLRILIAALVAAVALVAAGGAASALEVADSARAHGALERGEPRVETLLLTDAEAVAPGDTLRVGVLYRIVPDWHLYWLNSGEGGMATALDLSSSAGAPGPVQWPAPRVWSEAGGAIITFGYADEVLLFADLEIPADAAGEVVVEALTDYLVCKVECIPGEGELSVRLPVESSTRPARAEVQAVFERFAAKLPQPASERGLAVDVRYSHAPIRAPDTFRITVDVTPECAADGDGAGDRACPTLAAPPSSAVEALVFDRVETLTLRTVAARPHPAARGGWQLEVEGRASPDKPRGDARFRGVVLATTAAGEAIPTAFDVAVPRAGDDAGADAGAPAGDEKAGGDAKADNAAPAPADTPLVLWKALLLAMLGGMLLNLMPCVFPVLAVKVFAFVNVVHEERQNIYLHNAAYTGGILTSMLSLAAVVIGLKVVGTQVGWGFQFQEPLFVAAVGAVLVAFALNLFGVFEIGVNPGSLGKVAMAPPGPRRSFGEGVLAVVLATPCSAPFLGTAVGFALSESALVVVATFFMLGVGLALPFVVLTLVPGLTKFLPKPGMWMMRFKQLLGFALLGTVLWLAWIIGQMAGVNGMLGLLVFLLVVALAAWIYGAVQYGPPARKWATVALLTGLVAGAGSLTLSFDEAPAASAAVGAGSAIAWEPWSEEAVAAELAAGRAVFVDFTADWCITCKLNESTVLESREVREAIARLDVAMFMGDWTRRDERIRAKLAEFGKAGVPMYLVYTPDRPDQPRLLPELLTRDLVIEALEAAAPAP